MLLIPALFVSLIPVFILYLWFRNRLKKGDEGFKTACKRALKYGFLTVIPVMLFSGTSALILRLTGLRETHQLLYIVLYNFIVFALSEEISKFLSFRHMMKKTDYPFSWLDVTVLMTIVGIGFDIFESAVYAIGSSLPVILVRGICLPHVGYGFLTGYFYGKGLKNGEPAQKWKGLALAWLIHGMYDLSLKDEFLAINDNLIFVPFLLVLVDIILVLLLIRFAGKAVGREECTAPLFQGLGSSVQETAKDQIERITEYEKLFDEASGLIENKCLNGRLADIIGTLEAYYTGGLWRRDLEDDEEGKIPEDLKRGILSQDGIYDLLTDYDELKSSAVMETPRLILRPWEESDAEECFRYAKDPQVGPIAGWPAHTSVEQSLRVIKEVLMVPETYAIVLKETGLPVGCISIKLHNDIAKEDDEGELGFWIGAPYWGQGLMTEAAGKVIRHGFIDLGLERFWCGYYEGNERSGRVQEKLGFRSHSVIEEANVPLLGETRREYVNLLTKEDWSSDPVQKSTV